MIDTVKLYKPQDIMAMKPRPVFDLEKVERMCKRAGGLTMWEIITATILDPPVTYPERHLYYGISYSALKLVHKAPRMYQYQYIERNWRPPSDAMEVGTAVDMLVLQPELAREKIVVDDRKRTAGVKEEIKILKSTGHTVLKSAQYEDAKGMAESLSSHPLIEQALANHDHIAQKKYFARDPADGVKLQAVPDLVVPVDGDLIVIDIKTAAQASLDDFPRAVGNFLYDFQAAIYLDVVGAKRFLLAVVESSPPYLCAVYEIASDWLDGARAAYHHALWLFKTCCETGKWPGYEQGISLLEAPFWIKKNRERIREGF